MEGQYPNPDDLVAGVGVGVEVRYEGLPLHVEVLHRKQQVEVPSLRPNPLTLTLSPPVLLIPTPDCSDHRCRGSVSVLLII